MSEEWVLVAAGSNQSSPWGDPAQTVAVALQCVAKRFPAEFRASPLFVSPAFPAGAGPDYVNAACAFRSHAAPDDILAGLHAIEAEGARQRGARWASRTLDLDLLACGAAVRPDRQTQTAWRALSSVAQSRAMPDRLILPHPRLQDRAFVLVPLVTVAPDWQHPLTGLSVRQMLSALPAEDVAAVTPCG